MSLLGCALCNCLIYWNNGKASYSEKSNSRLFKLFSFNYCFYTVNALDGLNVFKECL